nr:MAG TPA: hypothetical protein [Caudoviricetes sp.]
MLLILLFIFLHSKVPPKVLSFNANILSKKEYIYPSFNFILYK